MANNIPISPARTPRRAVAGEFSHLMERMIVMAANRYEYCQKLSIYDCGPLDGSFLRNILSIRSVMRNPLTMLMVAATTAMYPSTWLSVGASLWPLTMMAPTTEIA